MFMMAMALMAPYFTGIRANSVDLTKHHAAFIMSVSTAIGTLTYAPVPYLFGYLAPNVSMLW